MKVTLSVRHSHDTQEVQGGHQVIAVTLDPIKCNIPSQLNKSSLHLHALHMHCALAVRSVI
jgi:hypothetical protein